MIGMLSLSHSLSASSRPQFSLKPSATWFALLASMTTSSWAHDNNPIKHLPRSIPSTPHFPPRLRLEILREAQASSTVARVQGHSRPYGQNH